MAYRSAYFYIVYAISASTKSISFSLSLIAYHEWFRENSRCDYIYSSRKIVFSLPIQTILNSFGILHLERNEISKLEKENVLAYKKTENSMEILVTDRESVLQTYPDATISYPTLDEIMLLYVKGVHLWLGYFLKTGKW